MNTNIQIFLLCPVPEDQKPITEYLALKKNFLTRWTTLSSKKYQKTLLFIFFRLFATISFFKFATLEESDSSFDWLLENLFFTTVCLCCLFFTILFRWIQLKKIFQIGRVFYEEASWYDGQIWEKPLLIIKNDRFLSTQKIRPTLQRIQQTFFYILFLLFLLSFSIFF